MSFNTKDLSNRFADLISSDIGDHCSFSNITSFENVGSSSLVFLQTLKQFEQISTVQPAVIVCDENTAHTIQNDFNGKIICVSHVKVAQAQIKQYYDDYQAEDSEWEPIHSSAVIHKSTVLGKQCRIGPGVVIGANCVIGDKVIIRAKSVIEHDVKIAADSIINSLVNIGYNCQLGERVTVQSGCIIGNEGYGFATDKNNKHHRIPHTGNVVLADDVHIGSNTCIDRGTYGSTIIERGVKIDNHCHIAHNVSVGENSLILAQTAIAGSSTLGKRVIASGNTVIIDHVKVADDVILVHRAGVAKSITEAGVWAGTPTRPIKEYVKNLALAKKVSRLELKLKELSSKITDKTK